MDYYQRQILLPELGTGGQQKLLAAKVLVIGAGGLSCPALQYLAAAGVGHIGIADGDTVEATNLHRQILYGVDDIGQPKAACAAKKLQQLYPHLQFTVYPFMLSKSNAWPIVAGYDIVLDGSDNFETRYLINDICYAQQKPLVYGAIYRFEGQVAVFNHFASSQPAASYRDVFPVAPNAATAPNCEQAGVLGVLPGIIGLWQAAETIKLITGIGQPLINQLLTYNLLTNESMILDITADTKKKQQLPQTEEDIQDYDYSHFCHTDTAEEIDGKQLAAILPQQKHILIDIRETGEKPDIKGFQHIRLPLSTLDTADITAITSDAVICVCHMGIRSKKAAEILQKRLASSQKVYSLKGGIFTLQRLADNDEEND